MDPHDFAALMSEDMRYGKAGIMEDLESKIPILVDRVLISKKYKKEGGIKPEEAEELVRKLAYFDPTSNKKALYTQYILTSFLKRNPETNAPFLELEDGERLKEALTIFDQNRAKKIWKDAGGKTDVAQYKDWTELEDFVEKFAEKSLEVERESTPEVEGCEEVISFSHPKLRSRYRVVRCLTPAAACTLGQGTRWCTSMLSSGQGYGTQKRGDLPFLELGRRSGYPTTAASYMTGGPLYIAYKDGEKWFQATHDFRQLMNPQDVPMKACSPATDFFLYHLMKAVPQATADGIQMIRNKCDVDYDIRPK